MSAEQHPEQQLPQLLLPTFSTEFLEDHAGLIIHNRAIAVVELVANSWDAGADRAQITWPAELCWISSVNTRRRYGKQSPTLTVHEQLLQAKYSKRRQNEWLCRIHS